MFECLQGLELKDQLKYNMQYLLSTSERDDADRVFAELTELLPNQLRGELMTITEQLRQQGRVKEAEKIPLNLLKQDHSVDFVAQVTRLAKPRVQNLVLDVMG